MECKEPRGGPELVLKMDQIFCGRFEQLERNRQKIDFHLYEERDQRRIQIFTVDCSNTLYSAEHCALQCEPAGTPNRTKLNQTFTLSREEDTEDRMTEDDGKQKSVMGFFYFFKDEKKSELARKRTASLLKQQKKAEEAQLKAKSERKRDEARRKAEEDHLLKEEKTQWELIKQDYLQRKQQEMFLEQGLVKPKTPKPKQKHRPKAVFREESSSSSTRGGRRDTLPNPPKADISKDELGEKKGPSSKDPMCVDALRGDKVMEGPTPPGALEADKIGNREELDVKEGSSSMLIDAIGNFQQKMMPLSLQMEMLMNRIVQSSRSKPSELKIVKEQIRQTSTQSGAGTLPHPRLGTGPPRTEQPSSPRNPTAGETINRPGSGHIQSATFHLNDEANMRLPTRVDLTAEPFDECLSSTMREAELNSSDVSGKENIPSEDVQRSKSHLIEVDIEEAAEDRMTGEQKSVMAFFNKDEQKAEDDLAKQRAAFSLKQQKEPDEARLCVQQLEMFQEHFRKQSSSSSTRPKPSAKSNKPIIHNAISHRCLAGKVNEPQKNQILEELEKCESNHLMILFRDGGCQFRALYSYFPDTGKIVKLTGTGPKSISKKMIDKLYKYNSDRKQFTVIPAKTVSVSVDALTIHNHLWQAKRSAVPKKNVK